jgi:glycosyltransferase involved in cell wall biosynthesis
VHCIGWRPYARLPNYLRGIDVALLPQRSNGYTRAMFPMKFFEYLAAGTPVVATKLPALAEFAAFHRIAETPQAFVAGIEAALADPDALRIPFDHDILQQHSWAARTRAMLDIVEGNRGKREWTTS